MNLKADLADDFFHSDFKVPPPADAYHAHEWVVWLASHQGLGFSHALDVARDAGAFRFIVSYSVGHYERCENHS